MKSLTLRSSVALAFALSLAGCGAGHGNLTLSGQIYGLARDTLVLQNNGGPPLTITANGATQTFVFPELLRNDEDFNVTIQSKPDSEDCTVTNGKGRTGAFAINNVVVTCTTHTHALTGTIAVSGITLADISGLVLVNGTDRGTIDFNAGTFKMSPVGEYSHYGVTILTQPANHTCTVENGVGTMPAQDVGNIKVTCV